MKTELTNYTPNNSNVVTFMFQNEKLNHFSEQIQSLNNHIQETEKAHATTVNSALCLIAYNVGEIEKSGCYKDDGFKSTAEYAMETFGYKKSQAFNLVRVGREYGEKLLATAYGFSQLVEMLPVVEKFDSLNDEGVVNPDMSMREIREAVKEHKKPRKTSEKVEKPYYWVATEDRNHEHVIGPMTETAFTSAADESHTFKSDNGTHMYVVRYADVWGIWERLETVETENKADD